MVVTTRSKKRKVENALAAIIKHEKHIYPAMQDESRLLNLPPELRLLILEQVLGQAAELPSLGYESSEDYTQLREPAIMFVCRLLRHDSMPVFYSRRTFFINADLSGNLGNFSDWVSGTAKSPGKAHLMSNVTFRSRRESCFWTSSITVDFSKVKIIDARSWPRSGRYLVRNKPPPAHVHMSLCMLDLLQSELELAVGKSETVEAPQAYLAMIMFTEAFPKHLRFQAKSGTVLAFLHRKYRDGWIQHGLCNCTDAVVPEA